MPHPPPREPSAIVLVDPDALTEEPTLPFAPILLAADGELLFFPPFDGPSWARCDSHPRTK